MIVSFVILNMFVAIVLQAFEASNEGEILEPKDLEHFVSVWSKFDPDATWFINASDVQSFLSRLKPLNGIIILQYYMMNTSIQYIIVFVNSS